MKYLMQKISLFSIIFGIISVSSTYAQDQTGVTGLELIPQRGPITISLATPGAPPAQVEPDDAEYVSPWFDGLDDWVLIESETINTFIPALAHLAIAFDPTTQNLEIIDPNEELSATQQAAIDRAPAWLRADLYDNFRRFLYSFVADVAAQNILDASDPYVDEIAFLVAHIAPGILGGWVNSIISENVTDVYTVDDSLHFVEIVDYGDSNDDDYWSTVIYQVIEENGDTVEVELDREYYYWYIVHPKLSDENPAYINPASGQEQAPPWGVFWRNYLWNHADEGYPLLSEQWNDCEFLWDKTADTTITDAVEVMNKWIDDVMDFGAGGERPIQPVRIYTLHCGNCGEYSDMRAALGRICLIPTVCTMNICEDHTWNEIYQEEWIHWDGGGGAFNNPLLYENGWGKTLSAVYNYRGDGYLWTVTDRYSEGISTLNVSVYDCQGKPADGYKVTIETVALWGDLYPATYGVTNSSGEVSLALGDNKDYYIRISGPLGNYPSSGTIQIITNSQPGTTYYWECTLWNSSPEHQLILSENPANPADNYRMEIAYQVEYESAYSQFLNNNEFAKKMDTGCIDFFMVDQDNYDQYASYNPVEAFAIQHNSHYGTISWVLPTTLTWYGVFSSRELSVNYPRLSISVDVYQNTAPAVQDQEAASLPSAYVLEVPHPNPFNNETIINFSVPHSGELQIAIYNLLGQEVITLAEKDFCTGSHTVRWNGSDQNNRAVTSGIYFIRMLASEKQLYNKVCYMR